MSDPVAVDAGLMAEAGLTLETTAEERAAVPTWKTINGDSPFMARLLRDLDKTIAALKAAEERGAERMRERVLADLSAHIVKNEERRASRQYGTPDIVFEERILTLDAARSRVRALPTTDQETTHG